MTSVVLPPPPVAPVRRMVWRLVPQPDLPARPSPRLRGARIVVLGGTGELAARVAGELRSAGALVAVAADAAGPWTVQGRVPDGLVDLTVGEPFVPGEHHGYRDRLLASVAALRACYAGWVEQEAADRIFYLAVTCLDGGMGYGDAPSYQPLGGIWAGLAKTLHREIPNCNTRVLDVAPDSVGDLPSLIARELYRWGLFEIGHRAGRRHSLQARCADPGPATVALGPADTVLVSGGGRGLGFRLAMSLAGEFGCRVVVTGRQPLPGGDEPWLGMGDEEFKAYERDRWLRRPDGTGLAEVRAELGRIRRLRELARNMDRARDAGAEVVYERCDFTDAGQVAALVGRLGPSLGGVIHNAGVDTPVRLPKKTDEDFLRTVTTKIDSFVTLFETVRGLPLKFFCNVGSLTGRLGGMTGQLDYGAANEGLARLGLWADRQVPFPVMTLCWPTWDRVGMIANFEATLRYMAALDVEEGLRLWTAELTGGSRGEITFVGPLGRALGHLQARGYPPTPDLPGAAELLPRIVHLGEPHLHRPSRSQTATVTFDRSAAPVLDDFLVADTAALPVALLLENAVQAAHWLAPEGPAAPHLTGIEELTVRTAALRAPGPVCAVRREMTGRHVEGRWTVDVRYHLGRDASPALRLRLRYGTEVDTSGAADVPAPGPAPGVRAALPSGGAGPLRWRGLVLPLARWRSDDDGRPFAELREGVAGDLWTAPYAPAAALPLAALENIWRHTAHGAAATDLLTVGRIALLGAGGASPPRVRLHGSATGRDWTVADAASGRPVLRIGGLAWSPAATAPPPPAG